MKDKLLELLKYVRVNVDSIFINSYENGDRCIDIGKIRVFHRMGFKYIEYMTETFEDIELKELFEDVFRRKAERLLSQHLNTVKTNHKANIQKSEFGGHPSVLTNQDIIKATSYHNCEVLGIPHADDLGHRLRHILDNLYTDIGIKLK